MAKYYTPSKKTIHEVGVAPDIEVPISDAEERRILLAQAKRELSPAEQAEAAKADDRQLNRAAASLRSILIYRARQASLQAANSTAPAVKATSDKPGDAAPAAGVAR
jgi:C-terminal processing protease CtpA/Prc